MVKLAPSILSADFSKLGAEVESVQQAGAHFIHIDVMDGHFVPNISFGSTVMKSLEKTAKIPFDVHLMIEDPDKYIDDFYTENTEYITVHKEACPHIDRTVRHIKSLGMKAGVAVNPGTSLAEIECVADIVDMVLVMSVNPGFGGQKFIPESLERISELRNLLNEKGLTTDIEVDGGISAKNIAHVKECGANVFVAGSAVFNGDIASSTKEILKAMEA